MNKQFKRFATTVKVFMKMGDLQHSCLKKKNTHAMMFLRQVNNINTYINHPC
jgi:hypothetical protein